MEEKMALEIIGLTKRYKIYERNVVDRFRDIFLPGKDERHNTFEALRDINLRLEKGELLGVIGANGAGKSTLLKIISGISQPTEGSVVTNGKIIPLLELGGGLNPEYSGRENIYFYCSLIGMKKKDIDAIYQDIVDFSELEDFIDVPLKKYSSGMKARLNFAVSVNVDPDILILDEVLAVGDELFKRKCFAKMDEFFQSDKTIIYVSHSLASVANICTRAILLHRGKILLDGTPQEVIEAYHKVNQGQNISPTVRKAPVVEALTMDSSLMEEKISDVSRNFYVENFISKARKEHYLSKIKIKVEGFRDREGFEVNHIQYGECLPFHFNVNVQESLNDLSIHVFLYTFRNRAVTSFSLPGNMQAFPAWPAHRTKHFTVDMQLPLNAGLYGMRIQIRQAEEDSEKVVANILDAYVFRILENPANQINQGFLQLAKGIEIRDSES